MAWFLSFSAILVVTFVIGYRAYRADRGFSWLRHRAAQFYGIAIATYAGLGVLDAVVRRLFDHARGIPIDGWTLMLACAMAPSLACIGIMVGYTAAVVTRARAERSWARLKDALPTWFR